MAQAINCTIVASENESLDSLLRRFKKATQKSDLLRENQKRAQYSKPSEAAREKHFRFLKRQRKTLRRREEQQQLAEKRHKWN